MHKLKYLTCTHAVPFSWNTKLRGHLHVVLTCVHHIIAACAPSTVIKGAILITHAEHSWSCNYTLVLSCIKNHNDQ